MNMVQIKLSMKCIMLVLNSFFAAAGLALLGVSMAVQLQTSVALDLIDGLFGMTPMFSIIMGAVMFLVAFLGCAGVSLQNRTMIITYTILVFALIVCEVALATIIFVNAPAFEAPLLDALDEVFREENKNVFHVLEAALRCCGNRGPGSYGGRPIPPSCCPSRDGRTCNSDEVYKRGCNDLVVRRLYTFASIVGSITIAVAALKVSLCLLPLTAKEETVQKLEDNEIEASDNKKENKEIQYS